MELQMTPTQFTAIIADDEPAILKGLKESINWSELDLSIIALAHDGREALNLITKLNPDIAIIDIKMPTLSGLDVIRNAKDAGSATDFIILSGYNDFSYAKDAIKYGARAYLLKPLDKEEFYGEVYRICSERAHTLETPYPDRQFLPYGSETVFFNNLIDSKILDSGKIKNILLSSRINLSDSPCYVLVLLFAQDLAENALEELPFPLIIAKLNEHFDTIRHRFWKYDHQKIIGIFNTSNTTSFQIAMQCIDVLTAQNLPLPQIGVGDTVSGLFECPYSYNRALTALSYQLYDDRSKIFTYEFICTVPPKVTLSDIDYLPLVQAIVRRDKDAIKNYCDTFIDSLLYVTMPPPNYVFSLCYALFNLIEQEFSSFSQQDITLTTNAKDLYQFKKLTQIRQWLTESFCQLSEFIDAVYGYSDPASSRKPAKITEDVKDNIIKTAKEYIHGNIQKHIKIEDIARQVHLSPSYFAIYFKNKTNINLRDYLLNEKMEYAKKKLSDPSISISDVAYDIGYGDYRSFSRAFKNIYGITPSDFQARNK